MQKSELFYEYPSHLVATEKKPVSRVMLVEKGDPMEVTLSNIINQIDPGDILVINETRVIPARVISAEGLEILFIKPLEGNHWQVLCPARKWPKGQSLILPQGIRLKLIEGGLPQTVESSEEITTDYLEQEGEMPLPPYIQQARGERHAREVDGLQYQSAWGEKLGSLAAPTASLHFSQHDLDRITGRGGQVHKICLHVGLGTFLPIHSDNLDDHQMHKEWIEVKKNVWEDIQFCRANGGKVWALGSTVVRALESQALGLLQDQGDQYVGESDLFIKPGFSYKVVDVMMTNFHQPESTLLAMVMAFAGKEETMTCYKWAIEKNFRLFSYGDLSVWKK